MTIRVNVFFFVIFFFQHVQIDVQYDRGRDRKGSKHNSLSFFSPHLNFSLTLRDLTNSLTTLMLQSRLKNDNHVMAQNPGSGSAQTVSSVVVCPKMNCSASVSILLSSSSSSLHSYFLFFTTTNPQLQSVCSPTSYYKQLFYEVLPNKRSVETQMMMM